MSDWHYRGIQNRDARHTPGDPDELSGGPKRKKDTKRWCRGIEGREHVPGEWVWTPYFSGFKSGKLSCKACGKCLESKFIRPPRRH